MNIKQQVLDHLLNLQEKAQTKQKQIHMRLALLGSDKSGKNDFFQYIVQYESFDNQKSKDRHCIFEIPHCRMELFVLQDEFQNCFIDLRCVSAIMFFRTSDKPSMKYVSKNLQRAKKILQKQLTMYNKYEENLETGSDVCQYLETTEAEPLILVVGLIDDSSVDITKLREQIFDENQRLQEIRQFDENCINILQVLSKSLIECYSDTYFRKLDECGTQSPSACGSQGM